MRDGNVGENNDDKTEITISENLLIKNIGDPIASIFNTICPSLLDNMNDPSFFRIWQS